MHGMDKSSEHDIVKNLPVPGMGKLREERRRVEVCVRLKPRVPIGSRSCKRHPGPSQGPERDGEARRREDASGRLGRVARVRHLKGATGSRHITESLEE